MQAQSEKLLMMDLWKDSVGQFLYAPNIFVYKYATPVTLSPMPLHGYPEVSQAKIPRQMFSADLNAAGSMAVCMRTSLG